MRRLISFLGVRFRLPKTCSARENRHSSKGVGVSARSTVRYALILALVLGASRALATAAVAGPTLTASFSTASTASTAAPRSLSVLSYNVAGMEFAKA